MAEAKDLDIVGDPEVVRRVFEQAPIAIVAFEGEDLRTWAANEVYRSQIFPRWVLGAPVRELFAEMDQVFIEEFDEVYRSGESFVMNEWRAQYDPDGSGVIEVFVDVLVSAHRNDAGEVVGVQCIVVDVTERVQSRRAAEARAQEMAQKYM